LKRISKLKNLLGYNNNNNSGNKKKSREERDKLLHEIVSIFLK